MNKYAKVALIGLGVLLAIGALGAAFGNTKTVIKKVPVIQTKVVQAPPKVITKTKVVQAPPKVITQVQTKTVTVQAPTPAPSSTPAPSAPAGGQTFHGTDTENIGTIHVPVDSTLTWSDSGAASDNFIINNSYDDGSQIGVNSLDQTSGKTVISAGDYHGVQVMGAGDWTFTITPGNSTQG
jgi:hypothetical protein